LNIWLGVTQQVLAVRKETRKVCAIGKQERYTMNNTISSFVKKWTRSTSSVHRDAPTNGQAGDAQVIDFYRKLPCPLNINSGGKLEGTLPGKAA
jgi:hypothetical protein